MNATVPALWLVVPAAAGARFVATSTVCAGSKPGLTKVSERLGVVGLGDPVGVESRPGGARPQIG